MGLRRRVATLGVTTLLAAGGLLSVAPEAHAGWESATYGPFNTLSQCNNFRSYGVWGWAPKPQATRVGACHQLGQGSAGWYFTARAYYGKGGGF